MNKVARHIDTIATEMQREHEQAITCATDALEHARRCGECLLEAKEQVAHGQWDIWLDRNFPASERTAQRYMKIAKSWSQLAPNPTALSDLTLEGALKQLAKPKPKAAQPPTPEPDATTAGETDDGGYINYEQREDEADTDDAAPADEPETQPEPQQPQGKPGKQVVTVAHRKAALDAFGKLIRALHSMKLRDTMEPHLEAIHEAIKGAK